MTNLKSRVAKRKCKSKVNYTLKEAFRVVAAFHDSGYLGARFYACNGLRGEQKHWHVTSGQRR